MQGAHSSIYDDLMRFKPHALTPNAWAMKAGVSRTVWADMRRHGNPSRRTLEKLLAAAGSSLAEFEALRVGRAPADLAGPSANVSERGLEWRAPQPSPIPLLASAMAGEWGEPISRIELVELRAGKVLDNLPRPVSLWNDPSAYAITIVGNSMWPRFRAGRRVAVSPNAAVAIGDDVVVKLKGADFVESGAPNAAAVLIKELVGRTSQGVELRQFSPDVTFHVAHSDILAVEKIVGELI